MNKIIVTILSVILIILSYKGLILYTESKLIYTIFTFVYFILLFSALYKPTSYSYVFLSIFLFLGMWLKLTLHLIFDYGYVEPIGSFYTLDARMNSVLIVAIIGALGVISSNLVYRILKFKSTIYIYENYICKQSLFYRFYDTYRLYVYITILLTVLILVYLNITYQIQLSGLVPKTILIYPFNAIVYWVIGIGFSLLLVVLFSLDIKFKNKFQVRYLMFLAVIMAITSIGLLSRGQYVFVIGSVTVFLLFNYRNLNNISIVKLVIFVFFADVLYLLVIESVGILRAYYFSGVSFSGVSFSGVSFSGVSFSGALNKILHLAVDRWVGLEGLMSVTSYEHRSYELFYNALTAKAEIGKIDIYQYISNAHYKDMDNTKFAFATIPGSMAFLYYTDSLLVVYFGIFVLSLLMIILEYYLYLWYKSALLVAVIGMYLANTVAQLGLMPINFLKSMFFTFSFLLIFKLIKIKKV